MAEVVEHGHGLGELARSGQPEHVGHRLGHAGPGGRPPGLSRAAEVSAELADAAGEAELDGARVPVLATRSLVGEHDGKARHQIGGLPGPLDQRLEFQPGARNEDLPIRPEPYPRARPCLRHLAELAQPGAGRELRVRSIPGELARNAAPEAAKPLIALAIDADVKPTGQSVDHGRADTVQAARGRIRTAAELAARVQPGHHQLDAVQPSLGLDVDGNPAPVVAHLRRMVSVQDDLDFGAGRVQGFVDRVVNDLPQAVQHATAVGRPDVHARSFANRLKALKDSQVPSCVAIHQTGRQRRLAQGGSHSGSPLVSAVSTTCWPQLWPQPTCRGADRATELRTEEIPIRKDIEPCRHRDPPRRTHSRLPGATCSLAAGRIKIFPANRHLFAHGVPVAGMG